MRLQGAALATTGTFLPFYALPYVTNPEQHPSFKGLFEADWVAGQRASLQAFLESLPGEGQCATHTLTAPCIDCLLR
jgi:hypothetical protein